MQLLATVVLGASAAAEDLGYVYGAYALVIVVLGGYAVFTIRRGRAVGSQLPPDERRWM